MRMTILTQPILNRIRCSCGGPDCAIGEHFIEFKAPCHMGAGVRVSYSEQTGCLWLKCAACSGDMGLVAVASEVGTTHHMPPTDLPRPTQPTPAEKN